MKILIIMEGFFPGENYGGPPVSVDNFCSLMNEYSCNIITHNYEMGTKEVYKNIENGWNNRGNVEVLYLSDQEYNFKTFEDKVKELNPDIIYLQGLFQRCIIPCLKLAKKYNLKVLLAPRGELCNGAFKKKYKKVPYIYYLKIRNFLSENVNIQVTSDEEKEAVKKILKIDNNRIHYLTNIPITSNGNMQHKMKRQGELNIVFVSRIVDKKNLLGALKILNKVKGNIKFDIYGPLEDEVYWESCKEEIQKLPNNIHVNYCGTIVHNEILSVFSKYDLFLFPTFSENYGHVIAESLVAGCPILISDQTPWTDVNQTFAGFAINLNNHKEFINKINILVNETESDYRSRRSSIKNYIDNKMDLELHKKEYKKVFNKIVN